MYIVSVTATDGTPLADVEAALVRELDLAARDGITDAELAKAKAQLKARLVFDNDSVTNIAHQLGYFETIAGVDVFGGLGGRIAAVTREAVAACGARGPCTLRIEPSAGSIRSRCPDRGPVCNRSPASHRSARSSPTAPSSWPSRRARCRPSRSTWPSAPVRCAIRRTRRARCICCRASSIAGRWPRLRARRVPRTTSPKPSTAAASRWRSRVTRHLFSLVCTCLAEDFEAVMALVGDIVKAPAVPEDELATRKGEVAHVDPPGRGQSRRARRRGADGAAVPGAASVRRYRPRAARTSSSG